MRAHLPISCSVLSIATLLTPALAAAQPEPEGAPPAATTTEATTTTTAPPPAETSTPAPAVTLSAEPPSADLPEQEPASAPEPTPMAASEPEASPKWYDSISFGAFVDAYASINYNFPSSQVSTGRGVDWTPGFALGWGGVDLDYDGEVAGATISLRFGPRVHQYNLGASTTDAGSFRYGLQYVKQAYATWKPKIAKGRLAFDLGKWDSIYGLETGDVQNNMMYSWPFLFYFGQPFYHTGLRVSAQLTDWLQMTAIATNGWNNTFDNNGGKSFGLQFGITPNDGEKFALVLGYMTGPEGSRHVLGDGSAEPVGPDLDTAAEGRTRVRGVNRRFRHLADLVMLINPTDKLTIGINGDFIADQIVTDPTSGAYDQIFWWGVAGTIRYAFTDKWATAARGDFYHDVDGVTTGMSGDKRFIGSATMNIEYKPVPNMIFRFENRFDGASEEFFPRGRVPNNLSRYQGTSMLAVIVSLP